MRYISGVIAAILCGIVFTGSSIAQKRAINALGADKPLMRNLVKSPLWLAAFAASFAIGAPLNMAAYMALGPTLPPALISIGLAATPLFARAFLGESPGPRSFAGAAMIASGVALIGASGVSIHPESVDWLDPGFLARAAASIGLVALGICATILIRLRSSKPSAVPLALAAGAAQALANALMSPIAGQFGLLARGRIGPAGLAILACSSLALIAVNFGSIAVAQLALRKGSATGVVPMQQVPVQILPLAFHVAVYRSGFFQEGAGLALACGIPLLILGAFALGSGRRKNRGIYLTSAAR